MAAHKDLPGGSAASATAAPSARDSAFPAAAAASRAAPPASAAQEEALCTSAAAGGDSSAAEPKHPASSAATDAATSAPPAFPHNGAAAAAVLVGHPSSPVPAEAPILESSAVNAAALPVATPAAAAATATTAATMHAAEAVKGRILSFSTSPRVVPSLSSVSSRREELPSCPLRSSSSAASFSSSSPAVSPSPCTAAAPSWSSSSSPAFSSHPSSSSSSCSLWSEAVASSSDTLTAVVESAAVPAAAVVSSSSSPLSSSSSSLSPAVSGVAAAVGSAASASSALSVGPAVTGSRRTSTAAGLQQKRDDASSSSSAVSSSSSTTPLAAFHACHYFLPFAAASATCAQLSRYGVTTPQQHFSSSRPRHRWGLSPLISSSTSSPATSYSFPLASPLRSSCPSSSSPSSLSAAYVAAAAAAAPCCSCPRAAAGDCRRLRSWERHALVDDVQLPGLYEKIVSLLELPVARVKKNASDGNSNSTNGSQNARNSSSAGVVSSRGGETNSSSSSDTNKISSSDNKGGAFTTTTSTINNSSSSGNSSSSSNRSSAGCDIGRCNNRSSKTADSSMSGESSNNASSNNFDSRAGCSGGGGDSNTTSSGIHLRDSKTEQMERLGLDNSRRSSDDEQKQHQKTSSSSCSSSAGRSRIWRSSGVKLQEGDRDRDTTFSQDMGHSSFSVEKDASVCGGEERRSEGETADEKEVDCLQGKSSQSLREAEEICHDRRGRAADIRQREAGGRKEWETQLVETAATAAATAGLEPTAGGGQQQQLPPEAEGGVRQPQQQQQEGEQQLLRGVRLQGQQQEREETSEEDEAEYRDVTACEMLLGSTTYNAIEMDVHRTFPSHPFLKEEEGQLMMRRILHAYALFDPEIGYVQGMNFVVGALLHHSNTALQWRSSHRDNSCMHLLSRKAYPSSLLEPFLSPAAPSSSAGSSPAGAAGVACGRPRLPAEAVKSSAAARAARVRAAAVATPAAAAATAPGAAPAAAAPGAAAPGTAPGAGDMPAAKEERGSGEAEERGRGGAAGEAAGPCGTAGGGRERAAPREGESAGAAAAGKGRERERGRGTTTAAAAEEEEREVGGGECRGGAEPIRFCIQTKEGRVFWLLVAMFYLYDMRSLFLPALPGVFKRCQALEKLMRLLLPDLLAHLHETGVTLPLLTSDWLLTLFTYSVPLTVCTSVWSRFFEEGWPFIYKVIICRLKRMQRQICMQRDLVELVKVAKYAAPQGTLAALSDALLSWVLPPPSPGMRPPPGGAAASTASGGGSSSSGGVGRSSSSSDENNQGRGGSGSSSNSSTGSRRSYFTSFRVLLHQQLQQQLQPQRGPRTYDGAADATLNDPNANLIVREMWQDVVEDAREMAEEQHTFFQVELESLTKEQSSQQHTSRKDAAATAARRDKAREAAAALRVVGTRKSFTGIRAAAAAAVAKQLTAGSVESSSAAAAASTAAVAPPAAASQEGQMHARGTHEFFQAAAQGSSSSSGGRDSSRHEHRSSSNSRRALASSSSSDTHTPRGLNRSSSGAHTICSGSSRRALPSLTDSGRIHTHGSDSGRNTCVDSEERQVAACVMEKDISDSHESPYVHARTVSRSNVSVSSDRRREQGLGGGGVERNTMTHWTVEEKKTHASSLLAADSAGLEGACRQQQQGRTNASLFGEEEKSEKSEDVCSGEETRIDAKEQMSLPAVAPSESSSSRAASSAGLLPATRVPPPAAAAAIFAVPLAAAAVGEEAGGDTSEQPKAAGAPTLTAERGETSGTETPSLHLRCSPLLQLHACMAAAEGNAQTKGKGQEIERVCAEAFAHQQLLLRVVDQRQHLVQLSLRSLVMPKQLPESLRHWMAQGPPSD